MRFKMKTLEEITEEVGKTIVERWKKQGEKELTCTPYQYAKADAQHAFVYTYILEKYQAYSERNFKDRGCMQL